MSTPTKEEKAWMAKVQKLLMNPPSERIGLFTTGDCALNVYDKTFDAELDSQQNRSWDFCIAVERLGVGLGSIDAAMNIHSTAG